VSKKTGCPIYLLSEKSRRIAEVAGKQAVPIINKALFSAITVIYPKADEQERIADCLGSLDKLIAAEAQKLDALKTHKKGLVQQLFPSPEGGL
jgi:type I restriction enzyme S subunit